MKRRSFVLSSLAASWHAARAQAPARRFRVAVIGHTGRGNFGHGLDTMWLELPETEIVAVADADSAGLEAARKKLKLERGWSDYREMLREVKPDIVSIAARHVDQHRDMALAAITAGARGLYMEKPFCRTLAEADEIIAACEKHGARLALAHRNRYHPVLPVLKKLIKEGAIGRPLEYRARGKEDARGGSLDMWVLGSHLFNLIHYFAGQPQACSAGVFQDRRPVAAADVGDGAEGVGPLAGNEVHARFEMADGLPAFFDSVQNAGVRETGFGLQIIGTEGFLDLRIDQEPLAHLVKGSPFRPSKTPAVWQPVTSGGIGVPEPRADIRRAIGGHLDCARDLLAAVQDEREPLCSARDARVILEMIMGVFESHRLGGARVLLPLEDRQNPLARL